MNDDPTALSASAPTTAPSAPAPPSRRDRKIAALHVQLRQQGGVIDEYRAKLRHATERAEADERLLAEQAVLLIKLSRDLAGAVEQLRAVVEDATKEGEIP